MKHQRNLSLVFDIAIAATAVAALIGCAQDNADTMWRYFTNLSNAFMALASLINIICAFLDKDAAVFRRVYYAATVAVSLTFMIVLVFLGPVHAASGGSYFFMFEGEFFFLHFLCPVLAFINCVFISRDKCDIKDTFFAIIPVCIYGIIYQIEVVSGAWEDFYWFSFGGHYAISPLVLSAIVTFAYLIALGEYKLHKLVMRKRIK